MWAGSGRLFGNRIDTVPVSVVQRYLDALAVHDAGAVCRTFSPQFQAFEARWEPGRSRSDCAERVAAAHLSTGSSGHMVTRIRLVRVGIDSDRFGNVAVRLLLLFRFPCIGAVSVIPGCRPHFERRRDVVFLREESGRWLIVKPGLIYQDTSLDAPPAGVDLVTPPGDSSTVNRLASIGTPLFSAPPAASGQATAAGTSSLRRAVRTQDASQRARLHGSISLA